MRGGKNQPMSDDELEAKFVANCIYGGLDKAAVKRALSEVNSFFSEMTSTSSDLFSRLPA